MKSPLLGVFGGSFDPIHLGHLNSIWELQQHIALDRVHFIPCAQSPLKSMSYAEPKHRVAMLELATQSQPNWHVDKREIERGGVSYMVDTMQSLHQDYPEHHLVLIVAMDIVSELSQWHEWHRLLDYGHLVIMTRANFSLPDMPHVKELQERTLIHIDELYKQKSGGVWWQPVTALDISATRIRQQCNKKMPPPYLLPEAVFHYIKQHQLYE